MPFLSVATGFWEVASKKELNIGDDSAAPSGKHGSLEMGISYHPYVTPILSRGPEDTNFKKPPHASEQSRQLRLHVEGLQIWHAT